MKKYLIVLAAALVALAGCKPNGDPNALQGLSFKQANVGGIVGDTLRLALVVTPAEAQLPSDLVWTSSDNDIVKVIDKKGNIALLDAGTVNITAESSEAKVKAVCQVRAYTYEEAWEPSNLSYFPSTISALPVSDTVIEYEYPSGIYKCQLFSVTIVGVNSLEFASDGSGVGIGVIGNPSVEFIVETPAGKEQFLGDVWDWVGFDIVDDERVNYTPYGAPAGEIDAELVGPVEQQYISDLAAYYLSEDTTAVEPSWYDDGYADQYEDGVYGTYLGYVQSTDTSAGWSTIFSGIITSGHWIISRDEEGYFAGWDYDFTAQWCYGYDGFAVDEGWVDNDPTTWKLKQPYELYLSPTYRYRTGEWGEIVSGGGAPQRRLAPKARPTGIVKRNLGKMKTLVPAKYEIEKLEK